MARKKTSKTARVKKVTKKELLSSPSSYRSLLFGIITVVVLSLIGISISQFLQNRKGDIDGNGLSTQDINNALKDASSYIVQPSDTLWSIAERELGSGFEWPKLADLNNIKSPDDLAEGMKLTIPSKVTPTPKPTQTVQIPVEEKEKSSTNTYLIKRGDTLWSIAEEVYKDGYRWVDIARANSLENNPDLIHADNTLVIPR